MLTAPQFTWTTVSNTWLIVSEHGSHDPSWQTDWQMCFPQLRVLSQALSHRVAAADAHFTVCRVFPHAHDFVVKAWHGGHGPGWQRTLHRCGQCLSRCRRQTSPQLCGVRYWWNSGSLSLPATQTHSSASETLSNKLAPYGTDGRPLTGDVSANFKVTWHKN